MVVRNRVAYLRRMLEMGAQLTVTVSSNPLTGIAKFKVIVNPCISMPIAYQHFSLMVLDMLDVAVRQIASQTKGTNTLQLLVGSRKFISTSHLARPLRSR